MRGTLHLLIDGIRTRTASLVILCVQVLVVSLVVSQVLFLVGDLRAASSRLRAFYPLSGWYQLNDTTDPAEFQAMLARPGFEPDLSQLIAWTRANEEIDLLVPPKTAIAVGDDPANTETVYLTSRNLAEYFELRVVDGAWPGEAETAGQRPVIVGHARRDRYSVGERISEGYYVAAVLEEGSTCYDVGAGMQPIPLDDMLITPFDGSATDAGTMDGVMNAPIMRFRTEASRNEFVRFATSLGLYEYRFWRLDDFLHYYSDDLRAQISLYSSAAAIVLAFAVSSFLLGILRSISSRRREFGIHLAYGAGHTDFWLATSAEFVLVVLIGFVMPLALIDPPSWEPVAGAFIATALLLALTPAVALARRSIPDMVKGRD